MITVQYDPVTGERKIGTSDNLAPRSLAIAAAGIVGAMVDTARELYGEAAAEAMLRMIRNMDDAGAFSLAAVRREEDGNV